MPRFFRLDALICPALKSQTNDHNTEYRNMGRKKKTPRVVTALPDPIRSRPSFSMTIDRQNEIVRMSKTNRTAKWLVTFFSMFPPFHLSYTLSMLPSTTHPLPILPLSYSNSPLIKSASPILTSRHARLFRLATSAALDAARNGAVDVVVGDPALVVALAVAAAGRAGRLGAGQGLGLGGGRGRGVRLLATLLGGGGAALGGAGGLREERLDPGLVDEVEDGAEEAG